jgi:hypothetical protein
MSITTSVTKLNENNYHQWSREVNDLLEQLACWDTISGDGRPLRTPMAQIGITGGSEEAATSTKRRPDLETWDLQPELEDDAAYMKKYNRFISEYDRYQEKLSKTCCTIRASLDPAIRTKFEDIRYKRVPKLLWQDIKDKFEKRVKIDGRHGMTLLAQCKLEHFPSVTEWVAAQKKITDDLTTCGIPVDDAWKVYYLWDNLRKSAEWSNRRDMLEIGKKTETSAELVSNLLTFEARIKRQKELAPDSALFVSRRQRGPG